MVKPLDHQRGTAARRGRRELDPRHLVGHPFVVERGHHPVGAAQHILRGNGFGGLGAHLGGLGAQRGGLAFGVGALAAAALFVGRAGVEVLLPAHVVDVDLAADRVEEPHPVDDVGEQVDVVADDDEPTGVATQEFAQPAERVGVEVVGRLVEQQRGGRTGAGVGGGEQDPGQLHPAALPAGQGAQRLGQNPVGQAETRADAAGLAFGGVPAQRGEPLLELTVAAHGAVAGGVVGHLGHQRLLLLQVGQQGVEAAGGEHPVAGQHLEVALLGILWQVTDFPAAGDGAAYGSPSPARMRMVVVLPAPLRPTSPIRSPGCTRSAAPSVESSVRAPARTSRSVAVITRARSLITCRL